MTELYIVDDHRMVLEGLSLLLNGEEDIKVTQTFNSANEVIKALENHVPDIILMDINMPELNGIEATKIIKKAHPEVQIIALSMISESNLIKLMLKNGATGYLHKNAGHEEIKNAIKQVLSGKKYLSEEISDALLNLNQSEWKAKPDSPFPKLSRREEEILRLILDEKTTQEISDELFISFGTVETHRRNIMIKLGVKNTAGLVRVVYEYHILG
ncbi:MAG: response regulator transcription factor [Saprospiraceae bacterium]